MPLGHLKYNANGHLMWGPAGHLVADCGSAITPCVPPTQWEVTFDGLVLQTACVACNIWGDDANESAKMKPLGSSSQTFTLNLITADDANPTIWEYHEDYDPTFATRPTADWAAPYQGRRYTDNACATLYDCSNYYAIRLTYWPTTHEWCLEIRVASWDGNIINPGYLYYCGWTDEECSGWTKGNEITAYYITYTSEDVGSGPCSTIRREFWGKDGAATLTPIP